MFGISEKEYDRQKHAERLANINAKQETFKQLVSQSTDDLVFIGKHALRKSFIHRVSSYQNEDHKGTCIKYFNFELNAYSDRMTIDITIPEIEMPFSEIMKLFKE